MAAAPDDADTAADTPPEATPLRLNPPPEAGGRPTLRLYVG